MSGYSKTNTRNQLRIRCGRFRSQGDRAQQGIGVDTVPLPGFRDYLDKVYRPFDGFAFQHARQIHCAVQLLNHCAWIWSKWNDTKYHHKDGTQRAVDVVNGCC